MTTRRILSRIQKINEKLEAYRAELDHMENVTIARRRRININYDALVNEREKLLLSMS